MSLLVIQAARALANLAAHADSDSNDVAFGEEAGALEALVQLTCCTHEGVRQFNWDLELNDLFQMQFSWMRFTVNFIQVPALD